MFLTMGQEACVGNNSPFITSPLGSGTHFCLVMLYSSKSISSKLDSFLMFEGSGEDCLMGYLLLPPLLVLKPWARDFSVSLTS